MDLAGPRAHRRKRVGDAVFRVVVRMDADDLGRYFARDRGNDFLDLMRQRPAVGVAENDPARSGLISRPRAGKSVGPVRLVAVEEMLAVDDRLLVLHKDRLDGCADGFEVFFIRDAERNVYVIVPRLGDEHDRIRLSLHDSLETGVVRDRAACALGHPESGKLCIQPGRRIEESGVDRVRAGIAGLDVIDAESVETLRNQQLVFHREVNA